MSVFQTTDRNTVLRNVSLAAILIVGIMALAGSPIAAVTNDTFLRDRSNTIVFIDSRVEDAEHLTAGLLPGNEGILVDASQDGILQIAEWLKNRYSLDALHIVTHGGPGQILLGTSVVNIHTMKNYLSSLHAIGKSLKPDGDILLYGCEVGRGKDGARFVSTLADITNADVAASRNKTGHALQGGDWILEVQKGTVLTHPAFTPETLLSYKYVLETMTFDSGASHPGFTLTGFSSDNATIWIANLGSVPGIITKDSGRFNVTSFEYGKVAGSYAEGNVIVVTSNLGHSQTYTGSGTLTLNWSGISWMNFDRQSGMGTAGDIDDVIFTIFVNTAPTVDLNAGGGGIDVSRSFTEDGGAITIAPDAIVSDTDGDEIQTVTITLTNNLDGGSEALFLGSATNVTIAGSGSTTLTLSDTGTTTNTQFQAALQAVTYNNTSQDPNMTARSITVVANDGTDNSTTATVTMSITPQNDPPTDISLTSSNVNEEQASGTVVGTLSDNDPD